MKVGDQAVSGLVMTYRTKATLRENCRQLIEDMDRLKDDPESLQSVIYNALRWTADDVLAQAIADGYKPTQDGAL